MNSPGPSRWVAVTGASGFVGRHVSRALRSRGIGVVALTRHPVPPAEGLRWCRFELGAPPAEAIDAMREAGTLIHLAWEGLPNYRAARHLEEELPRQCAFIRTALASGVRRLVVTGTCFEYGMQEGELHESAPTQPDNPYGKAKDLLRRHAQEACAGCGASLAWARLFYLYGEGQAPTSIWSQLVDHVRRGEREFPMSGGQQVRDFLPASTAAGHLAALASDSSFDGIVNVCSGEPLALEQTVRRWLLQNRWEINLRLGRFPYPEHEPFAFWGSRRRLDQVLSRR